MSSGPSEPILFSQIEIAAGIAALARKLAQAPRRPEIAVPVLMGAFVFAADLLRALSREGLDLRTDFVWLRSYGNAQHPGEVTVLRGPSEIVRGRNILLLDGVLDSGATLARARILLEEAGAVSITSVVAVRKDHPAQMFTADHWMFEAGTRFLFGYGMDAAGLGRGLPDIRAKAK